MVWLGLVWYLVVVRQGEVGVDGVVWMGCTFGQKWYGPNRYGTVNGDWDLGVGWVLVLSLFLSVYGDGGPGGR